MVDKPDHAGLDPNRKKYDVVVVVPDGWTWGAAEGPPTYLIVKLPGVLVRDAEFLADVDWIDDLILVERNHLGGLSPKRIIRNRSAWAFIESRLNPPILAMIDAAMAGDGTLTVPNADDVLAWIRKKATNEAPAWGRKRVSG